MNNISNKEERRREVRELVLQLDSYADAGRQLGLSLERFRQIAGGGLTTAANPQKLRCVDCRKVYSGLANTSEEPRCELCRAFFRKWGEPRTKEVIKRHRLRLGTHCKRGHELTPENIYVSRDRGRIHRTCRLCFRIRINARNQTPEGKAKMREYNRRAHEARKANPQKREEMLAYRRHYAKKRYHTDPEYRVKLLAQQRQYKKRKQGETPAA